VRASALAPLLRGRFCETLSPNRVARVFEEDEVLYEMADRDRTFFFVRRGLVKVGTITANGREIIYDVRKERDVVGELCALGPVRRDRAVAVERTEAVAVPFDEVMASLVREPGLLAEFIALLSSALAAAHEQVNRLAADDVMPRLIAVLRTLAGKLVA
jgi:CRP-like cAMP-binding protein